MKSHPHQLVVFDNMPVGNDKDPVINRLRPWGCRVAKYEGGCAVPDTVAALGTGNSEGGDCVEEVGRDK